MKQNPPICEVGTVLLFKVFILKFAFGPKKLPGLLRNGPLDFFLSQSYVMMNILRNTS